MKSHNPAKETNTKFCVFFGKGLMLDSKRDTVLLGRGGSRQASAFGVCKEGKEK